jgi:hypothetical protein
MTRSSSNRSSSETVPRNRRKAFTEGESALASLIEIHPFPKRHKSRNNVEYLNQRKLKFDDHLDEEVENIAPAIHVEPIEVVLEEPLSELQKIQSLKQKNSELRALNRALRAQNKIYKSKRRRAEKELETLKGDILRCGKSKIQNRFLTDQEKNLKLHDFASKVERLRAQLFQAKEKVETFQDQVGKLKKYSKGILEIIQNAEKEILLDNCIKSLTCGTLKPNKLSFDFINHQLMYYSKPEKFSYRGLAAKKGITKQLQEAYFEFYSKYGECYQAFNLNNYGSTKTICGNFNGMLILPSTRTQQTKVTRYISSGTFTGANDELLDQIANSYHTVVSDLATEPTNVKANAGGVTIGFDEMNFSAYEVVEYLNGKYYGCADYGGLESEMNPDYTSVEDRETYINKFFSNIDSAMHIITDSTHGPPFEGVFVF